MKTKRYWHWFHFSRSYRVPLGLGLSSHWGKIFGSVNIFFGFFDLMVDYDYTPNWSSASIILNGPLFQLQIMDTFCGGEEYE